MTDRDLCYGDICKIMEDIAPRERSLSWDSVGSMLGDPQARVRGVMTCLDVTRAVMEEALAEDCNVLVSHHPFIFHPLPALDYTSPRGMLTAFAVQNGFHIYSAHTNLDYAEDGVNRALAEQLALEQPHWDAAGTHIVGVRREPDLRALLCAVRVIFGPQTRFITPFFEVPEPADNVYRVGVSSGAFDGETDWCRAERIALLVTGEVKHSDAVDLAYMPFVTAACGHYATEHGIAARLAAALCARGVRAMASKAERDPFTF